MKNLKNKKILITGASSGIGKALAFELAKNGAILTLIARRIECLENIIRQIKETYPNAPTPYALSCDVTDQYLVKDTVLRCIQKFGSIDILINNAGVGVYGNSDKTTIEDFRNVMNVNFFGAIHFISETVPVMKKQGEGLIVNIASVAAIYGIPYLGAYSASKAALVALSQNLRAELFNTGISVMIVYPDYTQTDFFNCEKKVGGGHRPAGPYSPADKVAKEIIGGIKKGKQDLILSTRGKVLRVCRDFFSGLADVAMRNLANKLSDRSALF